MKHAERMNIMAMADMVSRQLGTCMDLAERSDKAYLQVMVALVATENSLGEIIKKIKSQEDNNGDR